MIFSWVVVNMAPKTKSKAKAKKPSPKQASLDDWKKCVEHAKKRMGLSADSYVLVKGALLKEAQKAYCAMGY